MDSVVERRLLVNDRIAPVAGSDSALVIRNVPATWHCAPSIDVAQPVAAVSVAA